MTRKARDKIAEGLREAIAACRHPPLAVQIEAVEAAAQRYLAMAEKSVEHGDELEAVSIVLDAAAETLRTLDFARETLR